MDKFCEIEAWIQDKTKLFETAEIAKFTPEERLDYEHSLLRPLQLAKYTGLPLEIIQGL